MNLLYLGGATKLGVDSEVNVLCSRPLAINGFYPEALASIYGYVRRKYVDNPATCVTWGSRHRDYLPSSRTTQTYTEKP